MIEKDKALLFHHGGGNVAIIFGILSYFVLVTFHVHKAVAFILALFTAFLATYKLPKYLEKMPKIAEKMADIKHQIRYFFRFHRRR